VNAQSTDAVADAPQASRWWRRLPVVIAFAAMLVFGAFLLWGPIGLGNGPLNAEVGGITGGSGFGTGRVGFIIPIRNSGRAEAVIDRVELIGGTRYAAPHLIALEVLTSGRCGGTWPAQRMARGFVLSGCGGLDNGSLIGRAIGPVQNFYDFPAAAEVAAPNPGTCWVMTKIVVHYHVGIRYYSATDPYELAFCADHRLVDSAMTAAGTGS
jgi:hypothetical protein